MWVTATLGDYKTQDCILIDWLIEYLKFIVAKKNTAKEMRGQGTPYHRQDIIIIYISTK